MTATVSSEPPPWRIAVPSSVTLTGIFFGLLSIALAADQPYAACLALIGASLCDMIDGRVARVVGARSNFGAELDSLADIVSFGLAPAWLVYRWSLSPTLPGGFDPWLLVAFAFVAAGAVRLARFNTKQGSSPGGPIDEFEGMPIPVAAMFVTTMVMSNYELGIEAVREPRIMASALVLCSLLMVSRLPLPSYKRFRNRVTKTVFYTLIACGLLMLALGLPGGSALLGFTCLYLIIGFGRWISRRRAG
ncbi:CDP-diacylglycerol--serine O-phosphatidyltransferase [Paraliomyxa miuraensis]|uniref:CDP-diacylglycerol--serine O-phosphatidyltransferase n=1 Tax=Paraliomyxa miuraensis TaxID=376150 RepID=UPI00224F4ABF|nr:CDP-diacylglycerol--serine O-phosphatidyltransferase [Paraliomyxa miuraensis]MCX4244269.1 CDP-diacylglycerol--serine O-phosphatidyltransferase [Paraliomyxa miuraensis]